MQSISRVIVAALVAACTPVDPQLSTGSLPESAGHHSYGVLGVGGSHTTLHLGSETPYATVVGAVAFAHEAGFETVGLAVMHEGELRELAVALGTGRRPHAADPIEVHIDARGIVVAPGRRLHGIAALESEALAVKKARPHETIAQVSADASTPLRELVAVVDALRGPGCDLDRALLQQDVVPEACWFWQVLLER